MTPILLADRQSFSLTTKYALTKTANIDDFIDIQGQYFFYKSFEKSTLAQRLLFGGTNTNILQYWHYLGGLKEIRGYSDNRFAGRYYLLSNTEFRHPIVIRKQWVVQTNNFLDLSSTREQLQGLDSIQGASAGFGLRLILAKIYRAVIRLDYAFLLEKKNNESISFGVQQFF